MSTQTVARRETLPAFAILPTRAPAIICEPAPSMAGRELTVVPETPPAGGVVDTIIRGEHLLVAQRDRSETAGGRLALLATVTIMPGFFASMLLDQPLYVVAAAATTAAVGLFGWHRRSQRNRRELKALGLNGAESTAAAAGPLERALLREAARRAQRQTKQWATHTNVLANLSQGSLDTPPEITKCVDAVFATLCADKSLDQPWRNVLDSVERLIWALEICPPEERPTLASFITKRLGTAFLNTGWKDSEAIRIDMLREALAGRRYKFAKEDASGEEKTDPRFDVAVAEVTFTLTRAASLTPKDCAWGRSYCADLETAKRVAAHFEQRGYRVSVGRPEVYNKPPFSVVAYADGQDPGVDLHERYAQSS